MPLKNLKKDSPFGYIEEFITRSQFTDGGSTTGTYQMKTAIPVGAYVINSVLTQLTGFAGDTTATLTIGDGSDVDRYNTGTPSVFTTAAALALGVPSGTKEHTAAVFPTLTITGGSDFTAVTPGALALRIIYFKGI
jgi:hypothetical protein